MKVRKIKKMFGVFLGRVSPLHKGHQMIIDKMISDFGVKDSLVLIGSSNSKNLRTPYTFKERLRMIKKIYPRLKVIGIPDVDPDKDQFGNKTLIIWINELKKIEKSMGKKFVFYGGSKKDLGYLEKDFETKVIINRQKEGMKISATKIRNAILTDNRKVLNEMIDNKIIPLALKSNSGKYDN